MMTIVDYLPLRRRRILVYTENILLLLIINPFNMFPFLMKSLRPL